MSLVCIYCTNLTIDTVTDCSC